jgi:hypothetical protein
MSAAAPILPDLRLIQAATAIDIAYTRDRLAVIAGAPGNPFGVEIRDYGRGTAFQARAMPSPNFNRAVGFTDETLDGARQVMDWFKATGSRFDIAPGLETRRLRDLLAGRGYMQAEFHATLVAGPKLPEATPSAVDVRRVQSAEDLEHFLDVYLAGWGMPEVIWHGAKANMRGWRDRDGWTLYLGEYRGQPAGAAVLFVADGVAYLADAATAPEFRDHGVHRALLDRRCADAAQLGVQHIFSQAAYLSTSYRNMIGKGLGLLYNQVIWRPAA